MIHAAPRGGGCRVGGSLFLFLMINAVPRGGGCKDLHAQSLEEVLLCCPYRWWVETGEPGRRSAMLSLEVVVGGTVFQMLDQTSLWFMVEA